MAGDRKKRKTRYNLYLLAANKENIEVAREYRFNRINSRYILVYTNELLRDELMHMLPSANYHIIDQKETEHLSDAEKVWLLEANVQIIAEETEKNQKEFLKKINERISRLEKELAIESEKLEQRQGSVDEE